MFSFIFLNFVTTDWEGGGRGFSTWRMPGAADIAGLSQPSAATVTVDVCTPGTDRRLRAGAE